MSIKVSGLFVYPIKSLKGISVQSSEALKEGFKHDRRMMIVDEAGKFISQRKHAEMSLIETRISGDEIVVNFQDREISIPIQVTNGSDSKLVTVWNSQLQAYEISNKINKWFSDALQQSVSLVVMGEKSNRIKEFPKAPFKTQVSFADGYPYLLLGTESLTGLNTKCSEDIPMDRFRPNIVLETQEAHIEDAWESVRIGDASLINVKPCARCIVTTIDQQTASKSKEPLMTLARYRKKDGMIYFGSNYICTKPGFIRINDTIEVIA